MTIIIPDNKIRNVKLTGDEIELLIDELERQPQNVFKFFNYSKIIKKLQEAKDRNEI